MILLLSSSCVWNAIRVQAYTPQLPPLNTEVDDFHTVMFHARQYNCTTANWKAAVLGQPTWFQIKDYPNRKHCFVNGVAGLSRSCLVLKLAYTRRTASGSVHKMLLNKQEDWLYTKPFSVKTFLIFSRKTYVWIPRFAGLIVNYYFHLQFSMALTARFFLAYGAILRFTE